MVERQSHPIGDVEHGQFVQTNKPLDVDEATPQWNAFASITVSTTVVNLAGNRYGHNRAKITVETNPIRFSVDGSIPTASLGHLLSDGDILDLDSTQEIQEFRAIRQGAADATLMVTFGNI